MKTFPFACCLVFLLTFLTNAASAEIPPELQPMYGAGRIVLRPEIVEANNDFIRTMMKQYGTRNKAALAVCSLGFKYLQEDDTTTAMKRFNEAWLLDPSTAQAFLGFGILLAFDNNTIDSQSMFHRATELGQGNVAESLTSLAGIYFKQAQKVNNSKEKQASDLKHSHQLCASAEKIVSELKCPN